MRSPFGDLSGSLDKEELSNQSKWTSIRNTHNRIKSVQPKCVNIKQSAPKPKGNKFQHKKMQNEGNDNSYYGQLKYYLNQPVFSNQDNKVDSNSMWEQQCYLWEHFCM